MANDKLNESSKKNEGSITFETQNKKIIIIKFVKAKNKTSPPPDHDKVCVVYKM